MSPSAQRCDTPAAPPQAAGRILPVRDTATESCITYVEEQSKGMRLSTVVDATPTDLVQARNQLLKRGDLDDHGL
jgi:hypothetical protein